MIPSWLTWEKTRHSDVRDDRRRLTVVRSLAYVQSYVHSPYMYTVLRCPANRWDKPLVQDSRIPTWDFGEIAGQSSCFSAFMRLLHIRSTVSFVLVLRVHIVMMK